MKNLHTFESFLNEGKKFEFSFDYNTDEDDVKYIQNILDKAGSRAVARAGLDMEEMFVDATNSQDLAKAKKAIQKDGFEINEAFEDNLNEASAYKNKNNIGDYVKFDDEKARIDNVYTAGNGKTMYTIGSSKLGSIDIEAEYIDENN